MRQRLASGNPFPRLVPAQPPMTALSKSGAKLDTTKPMKTNRTRKLPPFFTQVIGSLPRPKMLLDLLARRSEISADRFARTMDEMVIFAIRLQEQAGIDCISDGECRRRHYVGEFLQRIGGFQR